MKTVTIRLTAPLQSYGNEANFDRRTSYDYPSKSAVIGLIAAALGYPRRDSRIQTLNQLAYAVRVDQPAEPLTDFQIVEWKHGRRKLTYRDYLQDAVFMVAVGSEDDALIDQIDWALHHPHFQLALGRRANVLAGAIMTEISLNSNPVQTLQTLSWHAARFYMKKTRRSTFVAELIADAELLPDRPNSMVKDMAVSFDQRHRQYGFRAIAVDRVPLENPYFKANNADTNHDMMNYL
ncbi:type I-E CRISPR-associated protein Cas5/CasD [Lactiplantibacillus paraplantarum]|uniref:type I-E CRISPR-associated protein Cas5/CasD n=1 Tax=Lactiplantibacillus paraplantarum TaxID=60520 RepID=UPI0005136D13|nr:type I-E CRISPR-associated protein Cas5/CasD [Lactiplantibacillus paraplantarum]OAX74424.1 type I-E CRISPR-associated protein Cas5/CasD [Lactiplantibacillus plantarum]ALO03985.1 type I-E CRISPR-associated protein Cas5/CasD [Lactiplantibacillus paraplantarum]KGE74374.1 CRISPR-associated protein [Lactiplantibacillus paraplantarum]MCW1910075.1 type I-E CRISPR-associated protein Cas5/CasD [Lactiplantibacillus paraplantarum]RDG12557.1 type I-E CRISPR-associated protein Cas5/CasD [Lactiplantibaci